MCSTVTCTDTSSPGLRGSPTSPSEYLSSAALSLALGMGLIVEVKYEARACFPAGGCSWPLLLPRSPDPLDLSQGTPRFLLSKASTPHLEQGAAARDGSLAPRGVRFLFAITWRSFDPSLFRHPAPHRLGFGDLDYSRCWPLLTLVSITSPHPRESPASIPASRKESFSPLQGEK